MRKLLLSILMALSVCLNSFGQVALSGRVSKTNCSCYGKKDGKIVIGENEKDSIFTLEKIEHEAVTLVSSGTFPEFSNLAGGRYRLTNSPKKAGGLSRTETFDFSIVEPNEITLDVPEQTFLQKANNGSNDGKFTIIVGGLQGGGRLSSLLQND